MIQPGLGTLAVIATVSLALMLAVSYLLIATVSSRTRRTQQKQITLGLKLAARSIARNETNDPELDRVLGFSLAVKLAMFHRMAGVVYGSNSEIIRRLADQIGLTADMEKAAKSRHWWRRLDVAPIEVVSR